MHRTHLLFVRLHCFAIEMLDNIRKGRIMENYAISGSVSAAAKSVGVSWRTAKKYVSGDVPREPRSPATHLHARRRLLAKMARKTKVRGHRHWPVHCGARSIRDALHRSTGDTLSVRHVQRELHALGFNPYVRQAATTLAVKETLRRKAFARRCLAQVSEKAIVFSDESWLSCNERTGKIQWAKCRSDVLPYESKARWNVPSVMVWAAVGWNFKSELVVLPSKKRDDDDNVSVFRLDAQSYIKRCLSTVALRLVRERRLFQQDGARCHMAIATRSYLRRKGISWLEDWPPYSADLNMVEPLWGELANRVGARCPLTNDELIATAKEEWRALPQSVINKHALHFKTALRGV